MEGYQHFVSHVLNDADGNYFSLLVLRISFAKMN